MATINRSDVFWDLYRPRTLRKGITIPTNEDNCRFKIPVRGHQCTRKPVETIDDYGFCTQHAKIIRERLKKWEDGFRKPTD